MSRKPVDAPNWHGGYALFWKLIRDTRPFTVRDIKMCTNAHKTTVRDYILRLEKAGYVGRTGTTDHRGAIQFEMIRDAGEEAPRLRRDGSAVTQGRARENMWRTMKRIGIFTTRELAVAAATEATAITAVHALDYVKHLHKAGYLVLSKKSTHQTQARYRFKQSRDSGPRPPQVQRIKQVFDPNLGRVVWPTGKEDEQ